MITWEIVQEVYEGFPLEQLKAELEAYGVKDPGCLTVEVVVSGACERWSNSRQRFEKVMTPSFWPFEQGEILLSLPGGREPFNHGRKTRKWFVGTEEFFGAEGYDLAKKLSAQVKAAPPVFYE